MGALLRLISNEYPRHVFVEIKVRVYYCRLNELSHTIYLKIVIMTKYVRLCDVDIPREKWLNYLQTLETLISHLILLRMIWVSAVANNPFDLSGLTG